MQYVIYDTITGEILRKISCPVSQRNHQINNMNEAILEGTFDSNTQSIINNKIATRPEFAAVINKTEVDADGIDLVILNNIPINAKAVIRGGGTTHSVTQIVDGVLELTFDTEGKYRIKLTNFPYQSKEFTVNAS